MVKLDAEKFLGELGQLYSANRKENRRAIWLTIKRNPVNIWKGTSDVCGERIDAETASHFAGALMNVVRLNADDVREREPAAKRRKRPDAAATIGDSGASTAAVDVAVGAVTKRGSDTSNYIKKNAQHKAKKQPQKEAAIAHQHQREASRRQHARGDKREPPAEHWGR